MSLLQKYRRTPAPAKASIWYAICDIVQKGILVLTIPIFTRIMTTSEYGLTNVYNSWLAIITIFATLNIQYGTFNTAMVEFEDDRDRFIASAQGLVTTCATALFLVYLSCCSFINDITKLTLPLFAVMTLQMITTASYGFWAGKKRFEYLYKKVVALTIASAAITTLISIVMVLAITDNRGEVKIISTVLVQALLFAPIYVINFVNGKAFFVKKYWKFALSMNLAIIPYYVAQALFNNSDLLMIEWYCGMSDAALYGTVYSFATLMAFIINAINNSFVPWKYQKIKRNDFERVSNYTNSIAILVAILLVFVMLIGPEIIRILAAPSYFDARWVFPPVAASMFFLFYVQQFVDMEFLFRERLTLVLGSISAAVANIVLNALFIPLIGYIAAAYTTLVSYVLFVICNYYGVKKMINAGKIDFRISDFCNIKIMTLIGFLVVAFSLLCNFLYSFDWVRYAFIFVAVVLIFVMRKKIVLLYKKMIKMKN